MRMGRNPIKENQNPYFRARKQAAEWDARLESRERASELIGIAAYTLADYELGNVKRVPADKVLIMADLYNAPWLLSNYCKNELVAYMKERAIIRTVTGIAQYLIARSCSTEHRKLGVINTNTMPFFQVRAVIMVYERNPSRQYNSPPVYYSARMSL